MRNYFQAGLLWLYAGLVLLYILLTAFGILLLLRLSGVYISNSAGWLMMAGWCLFCLSSSRFGPGLYLLIRGKVRKPILEEEKKLTSCLEEVLQKAGCESVFSLRVSEEMDFNAFAAGQHTIVVTRGMLARATNDELKGVLAHELGHLLSKDTLVATAFLTAGLLPRMLIIVYKLGSRILWRGLFRSGRARMGNARMHSVRRVIIILVLAGYLLYRIHLLPAVIPFTIFVFLFSVLNGLFDFFCRCLSRCLEYRQDSFAYGLGYGPGLRQALEKIVADGPQPINPYLTIVKGSHPVIYNRIRRLEKLEGLRA